MRGIGEHTRCASASLLVACLYALPGPASLKRPEGLGPILMLARGCAARCESRSGCRPSILNLSKSAQDQTKVAAVDL